MQQTPNPSESKGRYQLTRRTSPSKKRQRNKSR